MRGLLRSPRMVGAVAPSSRFLARTIVDIQDWATGARIVEFGPGTGPFTREILARLPERGAYLGVERDPAFVALLRRRFARADFECGSVEDLRDMLARRNWPHIDHIVSGLPFASLPRGVSQRILTASEISLRNGGTFTTFQYAHAYWMPAARVFRRAMDTRFEPMRITRIVLRNLPPALVFTWRKRDDGATRGG